eukprot:Gb_00854 [translate_table: standard]
MLFISWWARPSYQQQAFCLEQTKPGSFNYDKNHRAATSKAPFSNIYSQELAKGGYAINHVRVKLGSGLHTYEKGKQLLKGWRQFQLKWASVDSGTCIKAGERFCVCTQELVPWVMLPLEILYVNDHKTSNDMHASPKYDCAPLVNVSNTSKLKAAYCFAGGTLQGHLLAGEERFSVQWDDDDNVWYEIVSFSRPAHFLSLVGLPYVRLKQKRFAQQSMQAMLKSISA